MRVYNEEVELDSKDPEQDYKQYKDSCESLAKLMSEIQELKASGAKEGVRMSISTTHTNIMFCQHNSRKHRFILHMNI